MDGRTSCVSQDSSWCELKCDPWISRVSSGDNPADPVSRFDYAEAEQLGGIWCDLPAGWAAPTLAALAMPDPLLSVPLSLQICFGI